MPGVPAAEKRQILLAEWLCEEVLAKTAHRHVVLTIPRLLRPLLRRRRELLTELGRAAAEAVNELVRRGLGDAARPGVVVSIATAGDLLQWHPHVHLLTTDGGRTPYSSRVRGSGETGEPEVQAGEEHQPRKRSSPSRGGLIAKVHQVDPLLCTRCGKRMNLIAFVIDQVAIGKILDHLGLSTPEAEKPPPPARELLRVAEEGDGWGVPAHREPA